MTIDCEHCSVNRYCGTVVGSLKLCRAAHPEYWIDDKSSNDNKSKSL